MKASNVTSARATDPPRQAGRSSGSRPTPTSADFALDGPSDPPDPKHNAYRKDLADVALAGRVIASHYAEPLQRKVASPAPLHSSPSEGSETVGQLEAGDPFEMLENSVGWAWGYGGPSRIVGYVRSDALD